MTSPTAAKLNRAGESAGRRILPKKQDTADAEALLKNLTERRKERFSDAIIALIHEWIQAAGKESAAIF